ncbi:MAG: fibronectin type III domain-containing protein [Flavobacterium micromati]|nr:fibronectin type III domain-containing protein [Flavobacterium micromati]
MRKIITFVCLSLSLISCGGGGSDEPAPAPEPVNTAPSIPTLVSPTNSKLCVSNALVLEWSASTDAENNPIVYQIQIATDNLFTQIVRTNEGTTRTFSITLEKGKAYYWRVKATDSKNAASAYSATFNFYTEGIAVINYLPFLPSLIQPEINATILGATASLKWFASDVDTSDILTYDVFFGTTNPPTIKVVDNKGETTFNATSLQATTIYYWRVVVKDNKGGETRGQVWNFKTN